MGGRRQGRLGAIWIEWRGERVRRDQSSSGSLITAGSRSSFRHPKLSAVRLAGELNKKPTDGASLDELLQRIKTSLVKLGPILDLEIVREPQGPKTKGGLTVAN
jgi:hypothetical protein